MSNIKIIIGLGNPGRQYANTRHNVGFMALDFLFSSMSSYIDLKWTNKFLAEIAKSSYRGQHFILVKPLTYMNLSGTALQQIAKFYQVDTQDILLIYDDVDLPLGKIRIRSEGSSGGHNGLKNIFECFSSQQFKRIRIGVDKSDIIPTKDYVLGNFSDEQKSILANVFPLVSKAAIMFLFEDFEQVKRQLSS